MERLDKILANTGRWTRKEARELIRAGRVQAGAAPPALRRKNMTRAAVSPWMERPCPESGWYT